jgi:hypothetical protein
MRLTAEKGHPYQIVLQLLGRKWCGYIIIYGIPSVVRWKAMANSEYESNVYHVRTYELHYTCAFDGWQLVDLLWCHADNSHNQCLAQVYK